MLCPSLFSLLWSLSGAHSITFIFHRLGSHGSTHFSYEVLLPGKHLLHLRESEGTEGRVIGSDSVDELTAHLQCLAQMLASSSLSPAAEQ